KAGEARAAGSDAPGGDRNAEFLDFVADSVDGNAAPLQALAERSIVTLEVGLVRRIIFFDDVGRDDQFGHFFLPNIRRRRPSFRCPSSAAAAEGAPSPARTGEGKRSSDAYRVKLCALPASTLMMLPVDLADMSEAKK